MPTLEDLVVGIAADVQRATTNMSRFERDFATVTNQVQRNNRRIESNFQRMQRNITRSLRGILPILSGAALVQGARRAIEYGDAIGVAADRLGVGVEFLQEFRFAAEDASNVMATQADVALQRFTRRVGEAAQGTGELRGVLEQYDIQVRNADGSARAITDVLADYADVVAGAESSQEQLRLAFKAFDSEGAALVNLLRQGSEGWEAYADAAREAGILTDQQVREAQELDAQLTRLSLTLSTNLAQAFISLGPIISGFVDALAATARGVSVFVEGIDRMLARTGASAGPNPDIATLESMLSAFDSSGGTSFFSPDVDLGNAMDAIEDLERRSEAFANATDNQGRAAAMRAHVEASRLFSNFPSGDEINIGGGGGGGSSGEDLIAQFERQTAAIWSQVDAAARLTEVERERAGVGNELRLALAEEGLLTDENRARIDELVSARTDATGALQDYQAAIDLVNDAIGGSGVSSEVAELAYQAFDAQVRALGLSAEDTAEALANLETLIAGENISDELTSLEQIGQQAGQSIASAFGDAILKGEELSDVLAALAQDLARLILQQGVVAPLAAGIGDVLGSLFHSGGVVGQGAPGRMVSPLAFVGAQRYHAGGIAGLAPNEVPAILERGERIIPNGGAAASVVVNAPITIENSNANGNMSPEASAQLGREVERTVNSAVERVIGRQMRVGGMLNRV